MGATRPASGKMQCSYTISKGSQTARITLMSVSLCHKNPDARRVAPISACVWCLRLVLAFDGNGTFTILQKLYLSCILHLTQTRCNSLIINTLLSVRCYQIHLHATYTTYTLHMLPRGSSTGGGYHDIGEQKSLLFRQIVLRPCGV